jgi:transcriptional regulator with XRE-family HTH domain
MTTEIGALVKELRITKGLSQRNLARNAGISNTEIWRLENGERKKPTPDILKSIAPWIGVSYEELLRKVGYLRYDETRPEKHRQFFYDDNGHSIDLEGRFKEMLDKDSSWPYLSYRISQELNKEDINVIKEFCNFLLNKK